MKSVLRGVAVVASVAIGVPVLTVGGIVAIAGIVVTVATAVSGAIAASPQLSEVHGAGDPSGVSPAPVPRAGLTEIDTPVAQL